MGIFDNWRKKKDSKPDEHAGHGHDGHHHGDGHDHDHGHGHDHPHAPAKGASGPKKPSGASSKK